MKRFNLINTSRHDLDVLLNRAEICKDVTEGIVVEKRLPTTISNIVDVMTCENYNFRDVLFQVLNAINGNISINMFERMLHEIDSNYADLFAKSEYCLTEIGIDRNIIAALAVFKKFRNDSINYNFKRNSILRSWKDFINYLQLLGINLTEEKFYLFYLDGYHRLLAEQLVESGFLDKVNCNFRGVIKKFTNLDAKFMVLMHNHPSGEKAPSKEDIETTVELNTILKSVEGEVYDHIIVTNGDHFSFRKNNLL